MRSMLAQLSPNEEITLRRVAFALGGERLPVEHMRRLRHLELVEESRGAWHLTALGRQRYARLEKPVLSAGNAALSDEIARILTKFIKPDAGRKD